MNLLIDAMSINSPGGTRQLEELVSLIHKQTDSKNSIQIISNRPNNHSIKKEDTNIMNPLTSFQPGGWDSQFRWYWHLLPNLIFKLNPDVFYSINGILPYKIHRHFPVMITINNMLPFAQRSDQQYSVLSLKFFRMMVQKKLLIRSARIAHAIMLYGHHCIDMISPYVSELNKKTKVVLYGISDKIKVDCQNPPPHPYNGKPYNLYFSQIYPYKNHIRLLLAYKKALETAPSLPDLILAGYPCDLRHTEKLKKTIKELKLSERIFYIGPIDSEHIPAWLHHAEVNYFMSLCETNSFITFEILAAGGVLACSRPSSSFDAEGNAHEPFDPRSVTSITDVILNLHNNPQRRSELRNLSLQRSKLFHWSDCARTILETAYMARENFRNGFFPFSSV